ncbi:hypothetical protein [Enterococcus sp. AZ196]|uniref:hypothetical protein n=1 Tax=Enterococcus sp. AZ196 TaxID=2774659 RepID=UPI003D2C52F8
MEIIEVTNHQIQQRGDFIEHEADVKISGQLSSNKDLVAATSIQVGFHPAKNGMYHFGAEEVEPSCFHVEWETYTRQIPFEE